MPHHRQPRLNAHPRGCQCHATTPRSDAITQPTHVHPPYRRWSNGLLEGCPDEHETVRETVEASLKVIRAIMFDLDGTLV